MQGGEIALMERLVGEGEQNVEPVITYMEGRMKDNKRRGNMSERIEVGKGKESRAGKITGLKARMGGTTRRGNVGERIKC